MFMEFSPLLKTYRLHMLPQMLRSSNQRIPTLFNLSECGPFPLVSMIVQMSLRNKTHLHQKQTPNMFSIHLLPAKIRILQAQIIQLKRPKICKINQKLELQAPNKSLLLLRTLILLCLQSCLPISRIKMGLNSSSILSL
jgi:hypothetical protein